MPSEILIELIQAALKSLGHYAGSPDGRIGPQTRTAIRGWQEGAGIEGTSELTRGQQQALIRESAAAGLAEARSTADIGLASSLLVGGIFGTLAPAIFGLTGIPTS